MPNIDLGLATKRELIVAAQEEICSTKSTRKQRQIISAIEKIAKDVRETKRGEKNAPNRAELREKLEHVASLARALRTLIQDPHVSEALRYGWSTLDENIIDWRMYQEIVDLHRATKDTPNLLQILVSASPAAVEVLVLKGRIGDVGPWWRFSLPAKVQLAIFGLRLYEIANDKTSLRGFRNEQFQLFLQIVWQVATEEVDERDWANAIKVAKTKRLKPGTDLAHMSARKRADDIVGSAFRSANGRGSSEIR